MLRLMLFGMLSACASSGGEPDERSTCEQLRDRLVSMRLAEVQLGTGVDVVAHRQAMTSALGDEFLTSCNARLADSQIECALNASTSAEAAACTH